MKPLPLPHSDSIGFFLPRPASSAGRNEPPNGRCVPRPLARPRALPAAPVRAPDRVLLSPPLTATRRPASGAKPRGGGGGAGRRSAWLAEDGSKRWGEAFFLLYTPFWLTLCLGIIVPFELYEVQLLVCLREHA